MDQGRSSGDQGTPRVMNDESTHDCECLDRSGISLFSVFVPPDNLDQSYDRWGLAVPYVQEKSWSVCHDCKGKVLKST